MPNMMFLSRGVPLLRTNLKSQMLNRISSAFFLDGFLKRCMTNPAGSRGAGKGSTGGSIKEAGGGMADYLTAQEESYFHNKSREQIERLRKKIKELEEEEKKKKD